MVIPEKSKEESHGFSRVEYVNVYTNAKSSDDAGYLQKNFSCEVVESVSDRRENGEDYYVFTNSCGDKVICF